MTNQEFSDEFDILYNSVTSNQAPGLDEYEKSVFLTKALSEIIKEYFNSVIDLTNGGFDGSEKRQYDFSKLIRVANLFNINSVTERITTLEKIDKRSLVFLFPQDYFLSVNEILSDSKYQYSVLAISYDEYLRLMLKPYAYPVKKAAWRLFTDKKNCNYIQEYFTDTEGNKTECDYSFLSTWADQKRNIKLTISVGTWSSTLAKDTFTLLGDSIYFKISDTWYAMVNSDCGWSSDKLTYEIDLTVYSSLDSDDDAIATIIKEGFKLLKAYGDSQAGGWSSFSESSDSEAVKAATHGDCFYSLEAPKKFTEFSSGEGKDLTTECIQLPIAEIIGRFTGDINYQLRYVKRPDPIILTNLVDVKIDGISNETPCELPRELHREILERAVSIAKLAYGSNTTETLAGAAAASLRNNNRE